MHPSQLPEKPLYANPGMVEQPERIYFFEKTDGKVIFSKGAEAWNMYSRRPQIVGRYTHPFKFIGSSDGVQYHAAVLESQQLFKEQGLEAAQARLRRGVEEELEIAKLTKIPPPNFDVTDKDGQAINLANYGKA